MKRVVAAGRLEDYRVDRRPYVVRVRSVGGVGARVRIPGAVGRYVIRSIHDTHEGRMAILADEDGRKFAHPYWDLRPGD